MPTEQEEREEALEKLRVRCKNSAPKEDICCSTCAIPNKEKCWIPELKCPICGNLLVKINIDDMDCAYQCFTIECRRGKLEAPIFYGYTQEDIDNNLERGKNNELY